MTKLALITAEPITYRPFKKGEEGSDIRIPCVALIGRDESGKKRIWRTPYSPWCFVKEDDFIELLSKDLPSWHIKDYEGASARTFSKKPLTKLYFYNSRDVDNFVKRFYKHNKVVNERQVYTYEADMSKSNFLALRYLIDKNIRSGVEIEGGEVTPIDLDVNLRVWWIDFEAYNSRMCSYGPRKDVPLIMITIYDTYTSELITLYVRNPKWKKEPVFKPLMKGHIIKGFDTEYLFLDYLKTMVKSCKPDMLVAWNLDRYDIIQWAYRMEANDIDIRELSPIYSVTKYHNMVKVKGIIQFDLMKAFKKFTGAEMHSYSLLYVLSKEELKSSIPLVKVPFRGSPAATWDKYPDVVFKRNVNDVLIIKALNDKYELIEMFDDLRKEYGTLFEHTLSNHRLVDTALLRFVRGKTALRTIIGGAERGKSFLGAVVVEPEIGKHHWIAQFDFSREYPNGIKAFNISPETYRGPNYTGPCYVIKYRDEIYRFAKKPRGILPQLIDSFFIKRDSYEKEYAKVIEQNDEVGIKKWWRRIFNVKGITNAVYGVMDYVGFRLRKKECTAATAALGRIGIDHLVIVVAKWGYSIIYGDTDSIFVQLKSTNKEDALKEAQELQAKMNESISEYFTKTYGVQRAPSEIGVAKIYSTYLLITKKYYAGKYVYDEKKGWKEDYDFVNGRIISFILSILHSYTDDYICHSKTQKLKESIIETGTEESIIYQLKMKKGALSVGQFLIHLSNLIPIVAQKSAGSTETIYTMKDMLLSIGKRLIKQPADSEAGILRELRNLERNCLGVCGKTSEKNVEDAETQIKELLKSIISRERLKEKELRGIIQRILGTNWKFFVLTVIRLFIGNYEREKVNEDAWYDYKGLEIIRSDSSELERNTLETIIKIILDDKPDSEAVNYWKRVRRNFELRIYDPLQLAYPSQIKSNIEDYEHEPAKKKYLPSHVRAAMVSNKLLNTDFEGGDKPKRLPVNTKRKMTTQHRGKHLEFRVRDISIAEDLELPNWAMKIIDYPRIEERLVKKVDKIFKLAKVKHVQGTGLDSYI